ncbi:hypothetical protein HZS_1596 [Henneguya salminicola]|nr:hypothetical protein HZS_1596 [Henneguya salminicola]
MDSVNVTEKSSDFISAPLNHPIQKYVILESNDGYQFFIKEEYTSNSGTIKSMLESQGPFIDNKSRTIQFNDIPGHILEKVCEYFLYKHHYSTRSSEVIPEFPIPPECAVELILVASFLDC